MAKTTRTSACCSTKTCTRCGCPVEPLTLVCPRCREPISGGCSGNCSKCATHKK